MGATAAIATVIGQGTAMPRIMQRLGDNRFYAQRGPRSTPLSEPSGSGTVDQKTARQQVWFRGRQFLHTHSPFTREC